MTGQRLVAVVAPDLTSRAHVQLAAEFAAFGSPSPASRRRFMTQVRLHTKGCSLSTFDFHYHCPTPVIAAAVVRELVDVDGWEATAIDNVVAWEGGEHTAQHVKAVAAVFATRGGPDLGELRAIHARLIAESVPA